MDPIPPAPPAPEPSPSPGAPQSSSKDQGLSVDQLLHQLTPTTWVTVFVTVVLLGAFGYEAWSGVSVLEPDAQALLDAGGSYGAAILDGERWRLFTATLLHAGVLHLLLNLWALWNGGQLAERLFGNLGFLALYLCSGLGGSLLSVAMKPESVSVGASGAIFGVFGALLAFMLAHRGVLPKEYLSAQRNSLLGFLGYNLVYGFTQPNIDLWGHAGGLVTGFIAGLVLTRDLLKPSAMLRRRIVGAVCLAGALVVCMDALDRRLHAVPAVEAEWHSRVALRHVRAKQFDEGIAEYGKALSLDPAPDWTWSFNRALAYMEKDRPVEALADMRAAHAKEPSEKTWAGLCDAAYMAFDLEPAPVSPEETLRVCREAAKGQPQEARFFAKCAFLGLKLMRFEESAEDSRKALALAEENAGLHLLRAVALQELKRSEEAAEECTAGNVGPESQAWEQTSCADAYWAKRDAARVLPLVDARLRDGDDAGLRVFRASVLEHLGRFRDALADLDKADELSPEQPTILNNRAWQKALLGDYAGAESDARRSLALRPDDPWALGTLCFALAGQDKRAPARAACAKALALRPVSPIDSGMLAYLDGKAAQAVEIWTRLEEATPSLRPQLDPWIAKARTRTR